MPEKESFLNNPEEIVPSEEEISAEKKMERYKDLLGESQAIFILDADIKKTKTGDRPSSYGDVDAHGYLAGGHGRIIAAAEIGSFFPDVKLVTTSYYKKEDPSHAEVYAEELRRMGIPEEQIELEKKSTSTLSELIEMIKMARNRNWENLAILTSDYHIPRTQEMLSQIGELAKRFGLDDEEFQAAWDYFEKGGKINIRFLSAEEILPLRDRRYKKIIESVRQMEAYRKRVEVEQRGLQQLKNDSYGKK